MIIYHLVNALGIVAQILTLLIVIRAVLSFFPQLDRGHPLVRALDQVVEPILRPFQRLLPPMGGLDFSPVLAIIAIDVLVQVISQLLVMLAGGILR